MKTIESCEMSNPSPPTLDDPDAVKMSKSIDEDDEIVKIKNGLKEKVGAKVENEEKSSNGCSSDSEMKEDEVQNGSNDSDLEKNGAESEQNGKESDQNGKEKSNGNEKTDSKDEESKLENGNDNSTEKDKSSEIEEDQTMEEEVIEKDDEKNENTDKTEQTDSNNEETLIKEKSESTEKQQDSKESEPMEVDSTTAEDQTTKSKKDEKDSEISFKTSENVSSDSSKNKEKEASEEKGLEKKESESKPKSNDSFGISFDLTKIPQHLIERRKAEEEKRKSDELKKPEANLELCDDDSDSDDETEDPKTPKSVASDDKNDEKNEEEESKEEAPKDDLNYNEALENLTKIQQESKKINDEELMSTKVASGGALKRPASTEKEDKEVKKVKLELTKNQITKKEVKSDEDDGTTSEIKKHLKKLTREQLENVVTEKISEIISARSEIGDLRRKVDSYEQENERWKKKQQLLQKMCMDLNTVMKRYIVDKQNSTKDKVAPIKITRSVGLQVVTDRNRRTVTAAAPIKTASPNVAQVAKTPPRPIQPAGGTLTSPGGPARAKVNGVANRPGVGVAGPASAKPHTVMQLAPVSSLTNTASTASSPASQNAPRLHTLPSSVSIIQTPTATAVTSTVANKVASTLQQSARSTPSPAGSASGNAAATAKKVIDIVDLSDEDEDQPKSAANNSIAPVRTLQTQNGIRLVPASQLRQVQNKPGGAAPTYTFNSSGQVTPTFTPTPQGRPGTQPGQVTHHQIIRTPAPRHPAPLPDPPRHQISNPSMKKEPPRPTLKISRLTSGIVLSWNMTVTPANHAIISSYQIYAYQETPQQKADATLWKKVGDVKALPLPMACTLTQFLKGNKYHFAVRAKDVHTRVGHFSDPQSIALT